MNALNFSQKVYGINEDTDRSNFNPEAYLRQLRLEVHPDKCKLFCVTQNIPHLEAALLPFFTQAAAALPKAHAYVMNWWKGGGLTPPVPSSEDRPPYVPQDNPFNLQSVGQAQEQGFFGYLDPASSPGVPV
jgi:hypothetical protein